MNPKAIAHLDQLPDAKLFRALADGMTHVFENAARIEADAHALEEIGRRRGVRILRSIAAEEAAKYLMLLDAARCPRGSGSRLAAHLRGFDSHLAKGIYAETAGWHAATFGELRAYVETERSDFYLDGPNHFDWIFRNEILQSREDSLYVSYVENDGVRSWSSPLRAEELQPRLPVPRELALEMAQALHAIGVSDDRSLAEIASLWRGLKIDDAYHVADLKEANRQTLERLDAEGLLQAQQAGAYTFIVNRWQFPLHAVDLTINRVKRSALRERQASSTQ